MTVQGGVSIPQSLVQWSNKSIDDVTWEDNDLLRGQFPDFNLEDKVPFDEGGIDRDADDQLGLEYGPKPNIWRVYQRKRGKENRRRTWLE
ncbi:hypothetical protein A2U01_0039822 [Trifolium medium]|uniref:RNA-directed DNA polymerase (Reverse transcriptase) n=1 Tax=Trifolium medium TaxID=97028 RepID=A0A392Q443_9FABA|nr:hypothetical protein [Trifolium medium]